MKSRIFVLFFVVILIGSFFYFNNFNKKYALISSFSKCVDAGFPITETYPEKCTIPGKTFINEDQKISNLTNNTNSLITYSHLTTTYQNEDKIILLKDGYYLDKNNNTSYFALNKEIQIDPDKDNKIDIVFLIQSTSTTFKEDKFYLAFAVRLFNGYSGANMVYIDNNISNLVLNKDNNSTVSIIYTNKENKKIKKSFTIENSILKNK